MPETHNPTAGSPQVNPPALVFQELLTTIVRVRAGRGRVPPMEMFRSRALELLRQGEDEIRRRGYSASDVRLATFACVAFLDESVLSSANPAFRDWPRNPLGPELFGAHVAGEVFFQNVRDLLIAEDSHRVADLLEVYLLCLLLGYRGRYGPGREADLRAIEDRIGEKLSRIRGSSSALGPDALPPDDVFPKQQDLWAKRLMTGAAVMVVLAIVLFVVYRIELGSAISGLLTMSRVSLPVGVA